MKINNRYLIESPEGYVDFCGIRRSKNTGLIIRTKYNEIRCTSEHNIKVNDVFVDAKHLKVGDTINNQVITEIINDDNEKYYYDPVEVGETHEYISEGVVHHNCAVIDEAAFIRPSIWAEFADSIFPAQSGLAWKKNIIISTMNGMNHFYDLVKGARDVEPGEKIGSNGYVLNEVKWQDVPRYKSDGSLFTPEEFQSSIIKKHGQIYFEQNYANAAIGSSYTLIGAEALKKMTKTEPEELRDGKLNIYKYPEKGRKYIMAVDSAKDGIDDFSVQIIDITTFDFEQVAVANLQIDYLLMPEFLHEWCQLYNNPYLIIENNEGAGQSIADQMYQNYEYENLHFDKTDKGRKKRYPGFRTTTKTRRQTLQTMKLFIDNGKLTVQDSTTINQFRRFILINNKYQADEGCKDDAIMSLAIAFAPFCNSNNFEDMKDLVQNLYSDEDSCEKADAEFFEYLTIGDFDDGSAYAEQTNPRHNDYEYTQSFDTSSEFDGANDYLSGF